MKRTYVFKIIHSTIGPRLDPFDRPNLEEQVKLILKPRSQEKKLPYVNTETYRRLTIEKHVPSLFVVSSERRAPLADNRHNIFRRVFL